MTGMTERNENDEGLMEMMRISENASEKWKWPEMMWNGTG
jgi:hypothetical protein